MRKLTVACCALAVLSILSAQEVQVYTGRTMGSTFAVKWHGAADPQAVRAAVDAELAAAESTFSQWTDQSEIQRFNRHRSTKPFAASERLRQALALGLQVAAATDGAFDPTVRPLIEVFRRQRRDSAYQPTVSEIAAARAGVDYRRVRIEDESICKADAGTEIDLDGLVAGLVADRLATQLESLAVHDFLLEITGEVLARGVRPDGTPWRTGVVDPERSDPGHEVALVTVPLRDRALCTSGDYRNVVVRDGVITSHIFDPRTGTNPQHGVVSVSVLCRSCALADALGTALMVLGPSGARAAIAKCAEPDAAALFVMLRKDGQLDTEWLAWPELFALDGRPLALQPLGEAQRVQRERDLAAAQVAYAATPDSVEAIVWLARRLGYLGRYREAIEVLTQGLSRHPEEPHLLRHRGHRYITLRRFDEAERDLAQAAAVVAGKPDEVEPDGQPSKDRPPHSTLHYNIHYHLGLARFLRADFSGAEQALRDCLGCARNDECRVAATHWLWCALVRQGKRDEANRLLQPIRRELDVVENQSYHQLCLVYRGDLRAQDTNAPGGNRSASLAFGLAHLDLVQGERERSRTALAKLAASAEVTAFGVIAAEAELSRR
jgi:thiamine biosynthesis lipoprotein ApbE